MTEKKIYEVELHRRVYDNGNGQYITVRPCTDFPGNVLLCVDKSQQEYWGDVRLSIPYGLAAKLGQAMVDAAFDEECKEE
ncbi:hypothetical protein FDI24_gp110 [Acidovorax phage ACP17]|uniref:Uncharacterized protein n=1 Tax=Acidovorax phage ACP17 TaxID=2010329 RepID=A0A218M2X9_9CAUD|nr:hypothetical protein FDI24_gp110 [Acidovorax phage ACP17]ASD50390.1 hypothetical protein [Acidovorax phage ACP17]